MQPAAMFVSACVHREAALAEQKAHAAAAKLHSAEAELRSLLDRQASIQAALVELQQQQQRQHPDTSTQALQQPHGLPARNSNQRAIHQGQSLPAQIQTAPTAQSHRQKRVATATQHGKSASTQTKPDKTALASPNAIDNHEEGTLQAGLTMTDGHDDADTTSAVTSKQHIAEGAGRLTQSTSLQFEASAAIGNTSVSQGQHKCCTQNTAQSTQPQTTDRPKRAATRQHRNAARTATGGNRNKCNQATKSISSTHTHSEQRRTRQAASAIAYDDQEAAPLLSEQEWEVWAEELAEEEQMLQVFAF